MPYRKASNLNLTFVFFCVVRSPTVARLGMICGQVCEAEGTSVEGGRAGMGI